MHHHLEVIMPPSKDIGNDLAKIMNQFSENKENQKEIDGNEFWDFYVIGGRWAGTKEMCGYDEDKLKFFYQRIRDERITVSGFQVGKQEISPAEQIPTVDAIWNEIFPTENGEITKCPVFAHSNNQYDSDDFISCDICRFDEIPEKLECSRVIFAGPDYKGEGIQPTFMICDEVWNGVNHMKTNWDGKIKSAIKLFTEKMNHYREEYKEKINPKPNWICITVDYHS